MEMLIEILLVWIGKNSDYDTSDLPAPVVVEMTAEQLTREMYSDVPDLVPTSGIDQRVFALYSWDEGATGTIYIRRAEDTEGVQAGEEPLENPVFQERLLHELIHHVQFQTGAYNAFPCRAFGEKQAYLLGGLFLSKRHARDPLPNRRLLAHIYSRC